MSKLIKEFEAGGHSLICLATESEILPELPRSDWALFRTQGFTWYTNFVAFYARSENWAYLIKISLADELTLHSDIDRAVLLPFSVPSDETVFSGTYMDSLIPFKIHQGNYQLLFETRFLTDKEIESSGNYDYLIEDLKNPDIEFYDERRPELCLFTFVPTAKKVDPKVVYPTYDPALQSSTTTKLYFGDFDPQQELILHKQPRPVGYT
jgi:Competence protein J (ComJ)